MCVVYVYRKATERYHRSGFIFWCRHLGTCCCRFCAELNKYLCGHIAPSSCVRKCFASARAHTFKNNITINMHARIKNINFAQLSNRPLGTLDGYYGF